MLLVIDVGNTNTVVGIFEGEKLVESWRVGTAVERTTDEFGILFKELLIFSKVKRQDIDGMIISCVVPPLRPALEGLGRKYFNLEPMIVEPGIRTGMPIHIDNPREVGADRIVNAVAGYQKYKTALIIIDFGTATTFDFVSASGSYEGGVIAPGLVISAEALFREASKLPRVELLWPEKVIGKSTITAMQSGILFGYEGLVDGIVEKMKKEIKSLYPNEPKPKVIATGGLANLLAKGTRSIEDVDENLTLEGLRIIYWLNKEESSQKRSKKS
jgi:type III pantothenate kinase